MLALRPYQIKAIEGIAQAEREGVRRPLVVFPTGTGKTVVFSALSLDRLKLGRVAIFVHRDELVDQTVKTLMLTAPELHVGVVKAERNELDADVLVVSIATAMVPARFEALMASHMARPFATIIADEAHHAPSPGWTRVLTGIGAFNPYGPLTVGFTATPERDKGKTLGVWEKVVAFMSIREAIYGNGVKGPEGHEGGYLVPILPSIVIETDMDLDRAGRGADGDFSEGGLGREMEASGAISQIVDAWQIHAKDRKTLAFTPTVKTAYELADEFRRRGYAAEGLDGTVPKNDRKAILARLKSGATQIVTNCAVLTEGFDEPSISCVVNARPTKFHGLYVQMVGRGTRLYPGKKDLMLLDVTGASKRHDIVGFVDLGLDLDEKKKKREPEEVVPRVCPVCEDTCTLFEHRCALCQRYLPSGRIEDGETRHENCTTAGGRSNVFGESRLNWLPVGKGWVLSAGKEVVVLAPKGEGTYTLATYEAGRVSVMHAEISSDWAMGIGEDRAKAFQKLAERTAYWRRREVSQAQANRLVAEGLPEKHLNKVANRGEAADLLTRIQGRRALKKMGAL